MENNISNISSGPASAARNALGCETSSAVEKYRCHVEHLNISESEKAELLLTIWHMMQGFVDRAFGDDAAQLCRKDGDENQLSRDDRVLPVISSGDHNHPGTSSLTSAFKERAGRRRRKEKR